MKYALQKYENEVVQLIKSMNEHDLKRHLRDIYDYGHYINFEVRAEAELAYIFILHTYLFDEISDNCPDWDDSKLRTLIRQAFTKVYNKSIAEYTIS